MLYFWALASCNCVYKKARSLAPKLILFCKCYAVHYNCSKRCISLRH